MENEREMEIDLREVFFLLLSKIGVIILSSVILAIGALIISNYFITPTYQSRLSLYVFNEETQKKETSSNDLMVAQRLVNSYIAVLQSDKFLNRVIDDVYLDMIPEELRKGLEFSAVKDTELFEIVVSAPTPNIAFKIANSIAKLAPSGVEQIVKIGRTEIVDTPVVASKQSSPNVLINTIIGALIGFIGSCVVIVILDMFNTKIKSKKDITDRYAVPILGSIPLHSEVKKWKTKIKM